MEHAMPSDDFDITRILLTIQKDLGIIQKDVGSSAVRLENIQSTRTRDMREIKEDLQDINGKLADHSKRLGKLESEAEKSTWHKAMADRMTTVGITLIVAWTGLGFPSWETLLTKIAIWN